MAIRKILVLVCDNCGQQEPTECQTCAEVKEAAKTMGWRIKREETLCRYCDTIYKEHGH